MSGVVIVVFLPNRFVHGCLLKEGFGELVLAKLHVPVHAPVKSRQLTPLMFYWILGVSLYAHFPLSCKLCGLRCVLHGLNSLDALRQHCSLQTCRDLHHLSFPLVHVCLTVSLAQRGPL